MAQTLPCHAWLCKANPFVPTGTLSLLLKIVSVLQITTELCIYLPGITGCSLDIPLEFFPLQQIQQGCVSSPGPARHSCRLGLSHGLFHPPSLWAAGTVTAPRTVVSPTLLPLQPLSATMTSPRDRNSACIRETQGSSSSLPKPP